MAVDEWDGKCSTCTWPFTTTIVLFVGDASKSRITRSLQQVALDWW